MIGIVVERDGRFRTYGPDALPLTLGSRPDCAVRVTGGPGVLASLGIADGVPFVQPGAAAHGVNLNGQVLVDATRLAHGDRLTVGGLDLECVLGSDRLYLQVRRPDGSAGVAGAPGHEGATWAAVPRSTPAESPPPLAAASVADRGRGTARWAWGLALVAGTLVAVVGWFTFTARSVYLQLTPAPTTTTLTGGLPVVRIGERYLARPGQYEVLAQPPGYYPLAETIEVTAAASQRFGFALRKRPGRLTVTIDEPAGVALRVDGVAVGVAPLRGLELVPGPHRLSASHPRYQALERELVIEGAGVEQVLELELIPGWGDAYVSSEPTGATVAIEGVPRGETPLALELMAGDYRIELSKEGWEDWSGVLTAVAAETRSLEDVRLIPAAGELVVGSRPVGATVSVDGEYQGKTPLSVALPGAAPVRITIAAAGYETATRTVTLAPGERRGLQTELVARTGEVRLAVRPEQAEVLVDGESVGRGSQRLQLNAVPHELEVRLSGYRSTTRVVTPRAGLAQSLSVRLEPEGAERDPTPPPAQVTSREGLVLRLVGLGQFTLGASRGEQGRRANETFRPVALKRSFYLGVKEVTNAEFRRFDPTHRSGVAGPHSLDGDTQPVVEVSWHQAARFCNWLSERDSLPAAYREQGDAKLVLAQPVTTGYRLPTEAEWAWAARQTGQAVLRKYPWGQHWPPPAKAGNYADRAALGVAIQTLPGYDDGFAATAPVGRFTPTELGFHDLGGNVAEWCHDYYRVYPSAGSRLAEDPTGPVSGRHHVIRGSSWRHGSIGTLRLSYRDYGKEARSDLGFRVARYTQ